jgi:hypothetical protein
VTHDCVLLTGELGVCRVMHQLLLPLHWAAEHRASKHSLQVAA